MYRVAIATLLLLGLVVAQDERQCLARAFNSYHASLQTPGAKVKYLGCYATYDAGVENTTYFVVNRTTREIDDCAAECHSRDPTPTAQFAYYGDTCVCIPRSRYVYPSVAHNSTTCCVPSQRRSFCNAPLAYAGVFELTLLCPLNVSLCNNLQHCDRSNGCCMPSGSRDTTAKSGFTQGQLAALQWFGGVLIAVGVVQLTWYCANRRLRRQHDDMDDPREIPLVQLRDGFRHQERTLLVTGHDGPVAMQGAEDARRASKMVIQLLANADVKDDDGASCTICLDDFAAEDSENGIPVLTPCNHTFHSKCLQGFVQHKLVSSLDSVTCPMCRAVLLVQEFDDESELGHLRQTIAEMRGHRTPQTPRGAPGTTPAREVPAPAIQAREPDDDRADTPADDVELHALLEEARQAREDTEEMVRQNTVLLAQRRGRDATARTLEMNDGAGDELDILGEQRLPPAEAAEEPDGDGFAQLL